jgi:hypothetical protein
MPDCAAEHSDQTTQPFPQPSMKNAACGCKGRVAIVGPHDCLAIETQQSRCLVFWRAFAEGHVIDRATDVGCYIAPEATQCVPQGLSRAYV